MTDYETPKIPPATPPAINPRVKPKTAAQMEEEGEEEGDVLADRSERDGGDIKSEMAMRRSMEGGDNGKGEQTLKAATMLPPD